MKCTEVHNDDDNDSSQSWQCVTAAV